MSESYYDSVGHMILSFHNTIFCVEKFCLLCKRFQVARKSSLPRFLSGTNTSTHSETPILGLVSLFSKYGVLLPTFGATIATDLQLFFEIARSYTVFVYDLDLDRRAAVDFKMIQGRELGLERRVIGLGVAYHRVDIARQRNTDERNPKQIR